MFYVKGAPILADELQVLYKLIYEASPRLVEEEATALANRLLASGVEVREKGQWLPCGFERQTVGAGTDRYQVSVPTYWVCSQCGRTSPVKEPYCHCGAKMMEVV